MKHRTAPYIVLAALCLAGCDAGIEPVVVLLFGYTYAHAFTASDVCKIVEVSASGGQNRTPCGFNARRLGA